MWKGLSVISDSPSPIVVVLSGSMEPAFQRGDLLLLWNRNLFSETNVGEIVVYNVRGKDIPIVHRIVRKFGTGCVFPSGQPLQLLGWGLVLTDTCRPDAKLLTKGDNNAADDTELYARGQDYLDRKDIVGYGSHPQRVALASLSSKLRLEANPRMQERRRVHAVRGLRHHHALRAPVAEDGDAGYNGVGGCVAARVEKLPKGHRPWPPGTGPNIVNAVPSKARICPNLHHVHDPSAENLCERDNGANRIRPSILAPSSLPSESNSRARPN